MSKNKIRLTICGIECVLGSDDPESYVLSIGDEVQKAMNGVMSKNDRISTTMAAVIAALSFCDDARKAKDSADNLRSQIKDYLEDSSKSRMEADESRREIERLRRELQTLRSRLSQEGENREDSASPQLPPIEAPVQQAAKTGSFSRPAVKSSELEEQEGFMSFFEDHARENS